ncbi:hypothetical protein BDW72DRAFT_124949 [Aspergillus terricola var. indicus]
MASYVPYAVGALGVWAAITISQYPIYRHQDTCDKLASILDNRVVTSSSAAYKESVSSYFSFQEQNLQPACVIQPATAQELSAAIVLLARDHHDHGQQFAIRSGGHMIPAGAANIQGGVTIDLRAMNDIHLSSDRSTVQIGTGATWGQVYKVLDPLNITVTGGRAASIGVGGYLTGGGLSAFGPATGWGCDNVLEAEVVLASGEIVQASRTSHPDLFFALRGGSNNFGVVTKFTMAAHPSSGIWGGFMAYPASEIPRQVRAYSDFMQSGSVDGLADPIQSYGWTSNRRTLFGTNILLYAKPHPHPLVLQSFTDNTTTLHSTLRITTMADFAEEEDRYQIPGFYTLYFTTTFAHDPSVYPPIVSEFNRSCRAISAVENMNWYMSLQPSAALNGENSLGLDPRDERLNIVILVAFFPNPEDSTAVRDAAKGLIRSIEDITRAAGVYRPFKYLNYADDSQDVIGGYGERARAALQAASRKYDREGVFQSAVPGGFKLFA